MAARRILAVAASLGMALVVAAPAQAVPSWCHPDYAIYSGGGWICLGPAPDAPQDTPSRIAGENRYATAAAVSASFWEPGEATTVYIANATGPDAIAAGASVDGPILLVGSGDTVPAVTLAEIERLAPVTIVGIGGPSAVSDAQLAAAQTAGQ